MGVIKWFLTTQLPRHICCSAGADTLMTVDVDQEFWARSHRWARYTCCDVDFTITAFADLNIENKCSLFRPGMRNTQGLQSAG